MKLNVLILVKLEDWVKMNGVNQQSLKSDIKQFNISTSMALFMTGS